MKGNPKGELKTKGIIQRNPKSKSHQIRGVRLPVRLFHGTQRPLSNRPWWDCCRLGRRPPNLCHSFPEQCFPQSDPLIRFIWGSWHVSAFVRTFCSCSAPLAVSPNARTRHEFSDTMFV